MLRYGAALPRRSPPTSPTQYLSAEYCFLFEDHPAVKGVIVPRPWLSSCRSQLVDELGSFLFRRSGRRSFLGAASAAQFHAGPSGGQKAAGVRRGRFEWLAAREHVPGRDQKLAGDRRLRRVLAVASRDPQVVGVPGV